MVYYAESAKTKEGINEFFNYFVNSVYKKHLIEIQLKEKYPEEINEEKLRELIINELFDY